MGILPPSKLPVKPSTTAKRRSGQTDFADLKPLKPGGTVGFSNFRDPTARSVSSGGVKDRNRSDSEMDSDEDEDGNSKKPEKAEEIESKDFENSLLSPEDARRQDEVAEGVQKIRVGAQMRPVSYMAELTAEPVKTSAFRRAPQLGLTGYPKIASIQHADGRFYSPSYLQPCNHSAYIASKHGI